MLAESIGLGVKEYYFTGGEPFLHRDLATMLEETLQLGPATVLTNGTVFRADRVRATRSCRGGVTLQSRIPRLPRRLHRGDERSDTGGRNVRAYPGRGGVAAPPRFSADRDRGTADDQDEAALFAGFVALLRSRGYRRPARQDPADPAPRRGTAADRGYDEGERLTAELLAGFDTGQLLCSQARLVSDRGVHVCPILLEAADGLLGQTLTEAVRPFALRHQACWTCYQHGSICANPSSGSCAATEAGA